MAGNEGVDGLEELLPIGLVRRDRLVQFDHRIGERLPLLGVEVGVLRGRLGERIEAPPQLRQRGLEGPEPGRDLRALAADAAEAVFHQPQEPLPLAAVKPDDGREVLPLFRRKIVDFARHLAADVAPWPALDAWEDMTKPARPLAFR
jgi:hypothetical protein